MGPGKPPQMGQFQRPPHNAPNSMMGQTATPTSASQVCFIPEILHLRIDTGPLPEYGSYACSISGHFKLEKVYNCFHELQ